MTFVTTLKVIIATRNPSQHCNMRGDSGSNVRELAASKAEKSRKGRGREAFHIPLLCLEIASINPLKYL
jgi:hypothetical protein